MPSSRSQLAGAARQEAEPEQLREIAFNIRGYGMEDKCSDQPAALTLRALDPSSTPFDTALEANKCSWRDDLTLSEEELKTTEHIKGVRTFLVVGYADRNPDPRMSAIAINKKGNPIGLVKPSVPVLGWHDREPPMLVVTPITREKIKIRLYALLSTKETFCQPFVIPSELVFYRSHFRTNDTSVAACRTAWSEMVSRSSVISGMSLKQAADMQGVECQGQLRRKASMATGANHETRYELLMHALMFCQTDDPYFLTEIKRQLRAVNDNNNSPKLIEVAALHRFVDTLTEETTGADDMQVDHHDDAANMKDEQIKAFNEDDAVAFVEQCSLLWPEIKMGAEEIMNLHQALLSISVSIKFHELKSFLVVTICSISNSTDEYLSGDYERLVEDVVKNIRILFPIKESHLPISGGNDHVWKKLFMALVKGFERSTED